MSGATHIRNVRPDEIEEVWRVHVASSSDLAVRRGGSARPPDEPVPSDARVALASDPDGYFCAVEEGRIRGIVSALVRGRTMAGLGPAVQRIARRHGALQELWTSPHPCVRRLF